MRAILLSLLLCACGGGGSPEPNYPAPQTLRSDLLYGYFGGKLAEVGDHINLHLVQTWYGQDWQLQEVIQAHAQGIPVMLDIADQLGLPVDVDAAEGRLRARLGQIQAAAAIKSIAALYFDEPDLNNRVSPETVRAMNAMQRRVAGEFGITPKIATIYTAGHTYPGLDSYDWVGFDRYEVGAQIFTNGDYDKLTAAIQATGKPIGIFLVPGCADPWKNDPTQFFNLAQQDKRVIGILVFAWPAGNEAGRANGWGAGCRANSLTSTYKSIGLRIKRGQ